MEKLKDICTSIIKSTPDSVHWEIDTRLNTALIVIESNLIESFLISISNSFDNRYDSSTIKKASKQERKLAKSLFGITKGQILFTSNDDDITLYGAWWPWGDNSKISLRIGLFTIKKGLIEKDEIMNRLKEWFSL